MEHQARLEDLLMNQGVITEAQYVITGTDEFLRNVDFQKDDQLIRDYIDQIKKL